MGKTGDRSIRWWFWRAGVGVWPSTEGVNGTQVPVVMARESCSPSLSPCDKCSCGVLL